MRAHATAPGQHPNKARPHINIIDANARRAAGEATPVHHTHQGLFGLWLWWLPWLFLRGGICCCCCWSGDPPGASPMPSRMPPWTPMPCIVGLIAMCGGGPIPCDIISPARTTQPHQIPSAYNPACCYTQCRAQQTTNLCVHHLSATRRARACKLWLPA